MESESDQVALIDTQADENQQNVGLSAPQDGEAVAKNEMENDTADNEEARARKKQLKREQHASKWKQDRKRRRTGRKRRPLGGPGACPAGEGDCHSEEDSNDKDHVSREAVDGETSTGDQAANNCTNLPQSSKREEMAVEEKRAQRALRKQAEITEFTSRCEAGATVVLDLEWEEQLSDRELKGLVQQVLYCYGSNRSALRPVSLVLSGVSSTSKTLERLSKLAGFPNAWPGVTILPTPYIEHFSSEVDRRRLVYLTADTDNVLKEFKQNDVYIIGGIVDRNRLKGSTKEKADGQGIGTGRLPLQEHIQMGGSSRVLTCNHVLDIILEHQRCGDWRATFEKCVPGRKQFIDQPAASQPTQAELDEVLQSSS